MAFKQKIVNSLKPAFVWLVIFLFLTLFASVLIYNGFAKIPSSAIYLNNFDDFYAVKTWTAFKTDYPALDPQLISQFPYQRNDINITVNTMDWWEEFTHPKNVLALHVRIKVNLGKLWLKLPSVLILLLDQTDRIRGKLYVQYSSEDFFLNGNNETEFTFWLKIPQNMQGQNYRAIVELFGIVDSSKSVNYQSIYTPDTFHGIVQPFMENDDVYGTLPSWYYIGSEYRYFLFLAHDQCEGYIPQYLSIYSLALYSWTIAGVIMSFSAFLVIARDKLIAYWRRNSLFVSFAILFVLFFAILFLIVVSTH